MDNLGGKIQSVLSMIRAMRRRQHGLEQEKFDQYLTSVAQKLMHHIFFVNGVVDSVGAEKYLEIGVAEGDCFSLVHVPHKIGIDPCVPAPKVTSILSNQGVEYYQMTSDAFFAEKAVLLFDEHKIDVAFVDGLHTYEQAYIDVENCLKYLADDGVIIMHDCNPTNEIMGMSEEEYRRVVIQNMLTNEKMEYTWCGDVWKAVVRLRSMYNDLNICVLDCDYGLGVLRKSTPKETLNFSIDEINAMTYADLEKNRSAWLNLKEPKYGFDILNDLSLTLESRGV